MSTETSNRDQSTVDEGSTPHTADSSPVAIFPFLEVEISSVETWKSGISISQELQVCRQSLYGSFTTLTILADVCGSRIYAEPIFGRPKEY